MHSSLANHLLIAMPSLTDPNFERSVIYICEHHVQGTVGLMINRPMQFPLGVVFDQMQIEPTSTERYQMPLLFGGPVQRLNVVLLFTALWVVGARACR